MNIVVNINSIKKAAAFDEVNFIKDRFNQLIHDQPQHHFFLLAADKSDPVASLKNCSLIHARDYRNRLLQSMWYDYRLPVILKKVKASLFVNLEAVCSFRTTVPQCLVLPHFSVVPDSYRSQKKMTVHFDKAAQIITSAQCFKNNICTQYQIDEEKVRVIYNNGDNNFKPLDQSEKEICKNKYTDGREYFLFTGELTGDNNLTNLLKAFSFFKKRQQSNMLLLIAATNYSPDNVFEKSLQTYKYRNEVKVLPNLTCPDLGILTAAAYSFVYATRQNTSYIPVLNAMQCGVPVIVSNSLLMNEICDDAALFTEPAVFENMADKMMLIFKDETLRNVLVEKCKLNAANFDAVRASQLLWQCFEKCAILND
ncbi:MAG: glycosyltransferase family 4 protein [Ferruginibacter sp.]|uniref:glycosyltransferase n=1 Tax=Ferruginibacter sp. TaxID=1940288 RepID=UPI0026585C00|nr:glycosyltransferase [Ferruginibacter sp.]MDB5280454.1 glycosyltransferase family 4 protein [Ferruginibacter sp.]